jgi:hypothetical protein
MLVVKLVGSMKRMAVKELKRSLPGILAGLLITCLAPVCHAGTNPGVVVAVHVVPHVAHRSCSTGMPDLQSECYINYLYTACDGVDVFPVFFYIEEYHGFEYGLTWPGPATCAFWSCSDLTIGDIHESGDGISQLWFMCQGSAGCVIPGFGWIESTEPGRVCVVPHPVRSQVRIVDCHEDVDDAFRGYCAGVCSGPGDNPCGMLTPLWIGMSEDACPVCVGQEDTLCYVLRYESSYFYSEDVSVVDYLPPETEYISSAPSATYDSGNHTVTWYIGEMGWWEEGDLSLRARLKPDAPISDVVINRCTIFSYVTPKNAAFDSTYICSSPTTPTTWGGIKSMFR